MRIALYKAVRPGLPGLFNRGVRAWCRGQYSHGELIFSDGTSASSSWLDGGVRFKTIDFDPEHWDIFEIDGDEAIARQWFADHILDKFDVMGLVGFIFRPFEGEKNKWFCTESVMAALGYPEAWRFDPCTLGAFLKRAANGDKEK